MGKEINLAINSGAFASTAKINIVPMLQST